MTALALTINDLVPQLEELRYLGLELHSLLGKGGQASVFRATIIETKQECAVKRLRPGKYAFGEAASMALVHHAHVVQFLGQWTTYDGYIWLAMELASCDLHSCVQKMNGLPLQVVAAILGQVSILCSYSGISLG